MNKVLSIKCSRQSSKQIYTPQSSDIFVYTNFIEKTLNLHTLSQVTAEALAFYRSQRPITSSLQAELINVLANEKEGVLPPVSGLLNTIAQTSRYSTQARFEQIATAYIEKTRFLFPLITTFAESVKSILDLSQDHHVPILLLRDGLSFWPAFIAKGIKPILLAYSRVHQEVGAIPSYPLAPRTELPARKPLLIDVGLYGSLVSSLISEGAFTFSTSVPDLNSAEAALPGALFFASRSPFIWGWMNNLLGGTFPCTRKQVDLTDSIRLADTLESLLKPFSFVVTHGVIETRITDPVSFVCSIAFLWHLNKFSNLQQSESTDALIQSIAAAKSNKNSWLIQKPIKRWEKADEFIQSWKHGPLFPMDRFSGFKL